MLKHNGDQAPTPAKKAVKNTAKKAKSRRIKVVYENDEVIESKRRFFTYLIILAFGVLLIFGTYAWLSTTLNVKINMFKMSVSKNGGLSISLDGVNFGKTVDISYDTIIVDLGRLYPNHRSQWSAGLTPVSSPGNTNPNLPYFDFYGSAGVKYRSRKKDIGYVSTTFMRDEKVSPANVFLAFDVFFKNDSGSPIADNLYLEDSSLFELDYDENVATMTEDKQEMIGLTNSARVGFLKIGSVSKKADVNTIQNVGCNGGCTGVIWEPNYDQHGPLSIERARKYGINLHNGYAFPTYAWVREGGPLETQNIVSGTAGMDMSYFKLQDTVKNLPASLFTIPDGITKVRIYIWLEGQDIDSLETDSEGADVSISLDFSKETFGYTALD